MDAPLSEAPDDGSDDSVDGVVVDSHGLNWEEADGDVREFCASQRHDHAKEHAGADDDEGPGQLDNDLIVQGRGAVKVLHLFSGDEQAE